MAVDVLSDLLRTVRLTGAVFFDVAGKEPWVAEQPSRDVILPKILPGAEHLIAYHLVVEGRCFARIIGEGPIALEKGEVIVFTHGDPHIMSSAPDMRAAGEPAPLGSLPPDQMPYFASYGGEGARSVRLVCGYLACDARPFNPLLDSLPKIIKVAASRDAGWVGQMIHVAAMESAHKRAGGETVLAKLSELMFVEVVRQYLATLPAEQAGWLAGLRDPFIGKALSLMHGSPAHGWTIEELAREVGQSRSVLAERFTAIVGTPPLHYLAQWRMQLASEMLSRGDANIARVAVAAGYESEAAFSRAFKKIMGVPPSVWRQRNRPSA
jgi:AraC-like DNA-binding protein